MSYGHSLNVAELENQLKNRGVKVTGALGNLWPPVLFAHIGTALVVPFSKTIFYV